MLPETGLHILLKNQEKRGKDKEVVTDKEIQGKYVKLRSVSVDDAGFIVAIRNDKEINSFIHPTPTDIGLQIQWIRDQIQREGDYYFIMRDVMDNTPIGLLSIYNISKEGNAEYGRWISRGGALQNVEAVTLLFDFAFSELDIKQIYMLTMEENHKVRHFWKSFGARDMGIIEKDGLNLNKSMITKEEYLNVVRPKNGRLLKY